jgi:hypothetical protein
MDTTNNRKIRSIQKMLLSSIFTSCILEETCPIGSLAQLVLLVGCMLSLPRVRVDAKILLGLVVGGPVGGEKYVSDIGPVVDDIEGD